MKSLVVIIDDSEETLEVASRYLTHKGFEVVGSSHGFGLTSLVMRRTPDVIVLDVMMPSVSGATLAEAVRKNAPHMPIVFYSAVPEDQGRELAVQHPGSIFVSKSLGVTGLCRAIQGFLESSPSATRA